jgi:hypothetical protein
MEKCVKSGKMYMKNNGTYFNLDNWIFCTTVYSSFVPLIKRECPTIIFGIKSDNYFPLTSDK